MTFWDMWRITKEEKVTQADAVIPAAIARGKMIKTLENISQKAADKKPSILGFSKAERVRGLKENKQFEQSQERLNSAFKPAQNDQITSASVTPIDSGETEDYSLPDMEDILFGDENNE